jgi:GDP-L-fucose synthase
VPIAESVKSTTVYIAGRSGLAGSAVERALREEGFASIVGVPSSEVDLRDRRAAFDYMNDIRPGIVVLAAARVGGIEANNARPVDFLSDNVLIQTNVMDAANDVGVDRLVFLGSSCIYPRMAPQPIIETSLLCGPLEKTNEAYAAAKIAGIMHVMAYRRQYRRRWIAAMPTNLYGPGDNFHLPTAHVLPALIRRFHAAVERQAQSVTLLGTGRARREFLHADDFGRAIVHLLNHYDSDEIINVGTGRDVSIAELSQIVAGVIGFEGDILFDSTRPDGTPQKLLDVGRLSASGWKASIGLRSGIASTYEWFLESLSEGRVRV